MPTPGSGVAQCRRVTQHTHATRTPTPTISVVVVDWDRRVRHSLTDLIGVAEGLEVVGVAGDSGERSTDDWTATPPDCCLIDPRLPELDAGMALMGVIRERWPETAIVAMSCLDASERIARWRSGADAFVAKSGQPDVLIDAVCASAGDRAVGRERCRLGYRSPR